MVENKPNNAYPVLLPRGHTTGDPAYAAARKALLADNPICYWCRRRPATEADHLIEVDREGTHQDGMVPSRAPSSYFHYERILQITSN